MSKSPPLPALLLGTLAGAIAGALASTLVSPTPSSAREVRARPQAPVLEQGEVDFSARIDELAMENSRLRMRLAKLEVPGRRPVGEFASLEEFEELQETVKGWLAQNPGALEEPRIMEEQIASALTEIRKKEAVTAIRAYQEKRTSRLEEDLTKIGDWLELDARQIDSMRSILADQYERETEQRRLWEEDADEEVLAEMKASDGERFRAELEDALSPDQFSTFWAMILERYGEK